MERNVTAATITPMLQILKPTRTESGLLHIGVFFKHPVSITWPCEKYKPLVTATANRKLTRVLQNHNWKDFTLSSLDLDAIRSLRVNTGQHLLVTTKQILIN